MTLVSLAWSDWIAAVAASCALARLRSVNFSAILFGLQAALIGQRVVLSDVQRAERLRELAVDRAEVLILFAVAMLRVPLKSCSVGESMPEPETYASIATRRRRETAVASTRWSAATCLRSAAICASSSFTWTCSSL